MHGKHPNLTLLNSATAEPFTYLCFRKMQRRVGQLKQQLEDSMEKEVTAHQYLANLITLAESITCERDELINMVGKKGAL